MEMDAKTYGEIMEALGGIKAGIESLDKKVDDVNKRNDTKIEKLDERVCVLEQKPAKRWDAVIGALIGAGIGVFVANMIK